MRARESASTVRGRAIDEAVNSRLRVIHAWIHVVREPVSVNESVVGECVGAVNGENA
jgi:hypothetical protein